MSLSTAELYFKIQRRPLLDTNVVQNLGVFPSLIFDGFADRNEEARLLRLPLRLQKDIVALRHLMLLGRRNAFDYIVSPRTVQEIARTKGLKRDALLKWAREVEGYSLAVLRGQGLHSRLRLLRKRSLILADSALLAFLPDKLDRELVADAFCLKADAFLTTDYKTILKHRRRLRALGLLAVSPAAYLRLWKPLEALYL